MTQRWFLIAHHDGPVHVHEVTGDPQDGLDDEVELLAAWTGMPTGWRDDPATVIMLAPGIPHKHLLAKIPRGPGGTPTCEYCYRETAPEGTQ